MSGKWENTTPVHVADVRGWLANGRKVALYIRHAERPPIEPDDTSFGASLLLTPRGHEAAIRLGLSFKGAVRNIRLRSAPMCRTRRTAQIIADGAGMGEDAKVEDAEEISVANVFLNPGGAHAEMAKVGVMEYMLEYIEKGSAAHCRPLPEATRLALEYLKRESAAHLNIFCGHDLMIAAALAGMRLARYTRETWIPFLTGMALAQNADGSWECRWFV